jgi:drug/metabolite transporter (DMT)-like permease
MTGTIAHPWRPHPAISNQPHQTPTLDASRRSLPSTLTECTQSRGSHLLGFVLVLLSSVFFCIQNVVVRILFAEQPLLGMGMTGGYLTPTLHNSFLLLLLRMLLAVPLMGLLATRLYPSIWREVTALGRRSQRRALLHAIAGGGLMFAYLALLYVSIGLIPTAIALTLFFTFPLFTALLSWRFFGQRPSAVRWGIMATILMGSALTIPVEQWQGDGSLWGIFLGVASGVAYALYTVNAQKSFDYLHPLTYTWVSFALTLVFAALFLGVWPGDEATGLAWGPIWIGSLISGIVTFAGHMLYNSGIKYIGATTAAMIGSANPALTVVLAWVAIRETLNAIQLLGVSIVTVSVSSLSRFK